MLQKRLTPPPLLLLTAVPRVLPTALRGRHLSAVVLDVKDVHFHSRWGMMQVETTQPKLLDLAARMRRAYARYNASDAAEDSESLAAAAKSSSAENGLRFRQRRVDEAVGKAEAMLEAQAPGVYPWLDSTPAESEIIEDD